MPTQLTRHPQENRRGIKYLLQVLAALALVIFGTPSGLKSQYFSLGTDPASIRWQQIKTEHFTIIFPESFGHKAQYIANAFEYNYLAGGASLRAQPKRFPVILHNQSVLSNAFVPYAPKRVEFLTTPPQENYSQDWIDQLIIHEFRHTVHYSAVNRGFTKALSFVIGQQALPAVIGLFVPLWFIEGDATVAETAMGPSGRGRVPAFEMKLKAQFLEKGVYNYDKAVHGSFKDFIPDRYELGYQLVGRTRTAFGEDVWANVLKKVGNIPLMVVPFSHSLKKQTGYGKVQLYKHLTSKMKEEWERESPEPTQVNADTLSPPQKSYTNFTLPFILDDGSILAVKNSLDDITRIVRIDSAGEERLFTPGTGFTRDALSASDSFLCWGEMVPDPRWSLRDYGVVKIMDLKSKKIIQLTKKTRYFVPVISPAGDRIATVEVTPGNQYYLRILDARDGSVLASLMTEENYFIQQPAWSLDGSMIVFVAQGRKGKSLMTWDISKGTTKTHLPFSYIEISRPSFYGDYILYTGAYGGMDNIFALNMTSGEASRITSSQFGATDAHIDTEARALVYSDYTADGYRLVRTDLETKDWQPIDIAAKTDYPLADELAQQEGFLFDPDSVPAQTYEVRKYRKGTKLFNFHSWAPLSFDMDHYDIKPGVMLLSQNLLGTSYTTLSYEYDLNEEAGKYALKYSYEGFYPVFEVGADWGLRRGWTIEEQDTLRFKYHELNVTGGVGLPVSWTCGSWFLGIRPGLSYSYKYLRIDPDFGRDFIKDRYNALNYRMFFYAQQKTSYRDLQPRWGAQLELNYRHTLMDSVFALNSIISAEGLAYLPGLARHHGFRIYGGYQYRVRVNYPFSNMINTARGHSGIFSNEMAMVSATYAFPVFYPDWRIGPIFYLKRLKGAVFYDHTFILDHSPTLNYNTVGLDLSVDFHFLSILAPLEVGLRSMYFPNDSSFGFQLLWGFNIDSLY